MILKKHKMTAEKNLVSTQIIKIKLKKSSYKQKKEQKKKVYLHTFNSCHHVLVKWCEI